MNIPFRLYTRNAHFDLHQNTPNVQDPSDLKISLAWCDPMCRFELLGTVLLLSHQLTDRNKKRKEKEVSYEHPRIYLANH